MEPVWDDDEGLGLSPISHSFADPQPVIFEAETDATLRSMTTRCVPTSLDLKGIDCDNIIEKSLKSLAKQRDKTENRYSRRSNLSPIKCSPEKRVDKRKNDKKNLSELFESCVMERTQQNATSGRKFDKFEYNHEMNLFEERIKKSLLNMSKNRSISASSDLPSSASSSGSTRPPSSLQSESTDKRSLYNEIYRARGLFKEAPTNVSRSSCYSISDSGFDLKALDDTTLINSSTFLEVGRKNGTIERLVEQLGPAVAEQILTNAAEKMRSEKETNTSAVFSTSQLYHMNKHHKNANTSTTRLFRDSSVEVARNATTTSRHQLKPSIVNLGIDSEVETSKSSRNLQKEETPILRSSNVIEEESLHHSSSAQNLPIKKVNPPFRRYMNTSLPNLRNAKDRDVYHELADIDEMWLKGVRRNPKSTDKMFGGKEAAKIVHGDQKQEVQFVAPPRRTVQKMTKATEAKKKSTTTKRAEKFFVPVGPDGVTHSVRAIGQQLLSAMKSRYPEWVPLTQVLIEQPADVDVAEYFCRELRIRHKKTREKYRQNREFRNQDAIIESTTEIVKIERVLKKMEELMSESKLPRSHQLKFMMIAVLSS